MFKLRELQLIHDLKEKVKSCEDVEGIVKSMIEVIKAEKNKLMIQQLEIEAELRKLGRDPKAVLEAASSEAGDLQEFGMDPAELCRAVMECNEAEVLAANASDEEVENSETFDTDIDLDKLKSGLAEGTAAEGVDEEEEEEEDEDVNTIDQGIKGVFIEKETD